MEHQKAPDRIWRLKGRLSAPIRRFLRDEDATIIAETVVVLPILLWAYIGLFVYWDTFRTINTLQKATYTISDMISRQQTGIVSNYINGAHSVLDYLIDDGVVSTLRVTSVTFSQANNRFEVHWSRTTDGAKLPALTTVSLQDYSAQIPVMTPGDYVVIVEVILPYTPAFNVGLGPQTFSQFVVTRPRFLPCIPMDNVSCPVS